MLTTSILTCMPHNMLGLIEVQNYCRKAEVQFLLAEFPDRKLTHCLNKKTIMYVVVVVEITIVGVY